MFKSKIFFAFIWILFTSLCELNAQTVYYVRMQDATGIDLSSYQTELNTAATDLDLALPTAFQSAFKVYDYGFYLHNDKMDGGVDKIINEAEDIIKAQSTYYLMISRVLDTKGNITNYVRVKLPTTGGLHCLKSELFGYIQGKVLSKLNVSLDPVIIKNGIISGLNELKSYTLDKVSCCLTRESCGECLDIPDFTAFLEQQGFKKISFDDINDNQSITNPSPDVDEFVNLIYTKDNIEHNINAEIKSFFAGLGSLFDVKHAEIDRYDQLGNCTQTMGAITSLPDKSKLYIDVKVIETIIDKNTKNLDIQVSTNFYDMFDGKSAEHGNIYVYLDDDNLDLNSIVNQAKAFYKLAGIKINIKPIYNSENLKKLKIHTNDGILFIGNLFTMETLFPELKKCGVISPPDYVDFMRDWFPQYAPQGIEHVGKEISVALSNSNAIDQYTTFFKNTDPQHYNSNNIEDNPDRLFAFLLLHITSHFAGITDAQGLGWNGDSSYIGTLIYQHQTFENIIKEFKMHPDMIQQIITVNGFFLN
ncbi:MAG TPA: hypothetical protein VK590_13765 [Saprospiraceae bacterium]|nr:hypothetical protein [Saprospiraceae bacterium]